jgi:hypothetical protein
MQQIRLFKGVENELRELEHEVNGWIRQNKVRVVSIQANIAPQSIHADSKAGLGSSTFSASDVLVTVVYETT